MNTTVDEVPVLIVGGGPAGLTASLLLSRMTVPILYYLSERRKHAPFENRKKINRAVKNIEKGAETATESDDPKVRAMIAGHARAMKRRLENKQPIRHWAPLFAEFFKHADKINMRIIDTAKGVKVIETSDDARVVKLIQSQASGVSEFVEEGPSSMREDHPRRPGALYARTTPPGRGESD